MSPKSTHVTRYLNTFISKTHKNRKWLTVVVANEFQIPFHDEKALGLFKQFLQSEKPDWLVLNGDFQDFWEISSFDLTPRRSDALSCSCRHALVVATRQPAVYAQCVDRAVCAVG